MLDTQHEMDGAASKPKASKMTARSTLAVFALGLTVGSVAISGEFETDVGSSERINLAGQLGTISQRILASACNLDAGVATVESNAVLQISVNHYQKISDALLFGNRGMGILGEEGRPRTLQAISALNSYWGPMSETAAATVIDANNAAHIEGLAGQSDEILHEAFILLSELTGQYADPVALIHADALLIDIAGRQRMLAERMSKDVCLISSGIADDRAMEDLVAAMAMFDRSLRGLQQGVPSVGLLPPPTLKIEEGLQVVADEWAQLTPVLQSVIDGATLTDAERSEVFFAFLGMEARLNNVVHMYDDNSKLNL